MKKRIVSLFLALILALSLMETAFASAASRPTIGNMGQGVTAELTEGDKAVNVTVTGLQQNQQYMVLMISGIYTDPAVAGTKVTESSIRYIDQQPDTNGSLNFKVYPDSMQSSTILLSGTDGQGLRVLATVEVPYKIGDANGDTKITINDASAIAKHVVKIAVLTGDRFQAADVTHDNKVTINDASKIARYVVKIITSLD